MNVTVDPIERALAEGATPGTVLDLADQEIEAASADENWSRLERLAAALETTAAERGEAWSGLAIAAARARALAGGAGGRAPAEGEPRVTVLEPAVPPSPPPRTAAAAGTESAYAGWWRRAVAFAIDVVAVSTLYVLFGELRPADSDSLIWAVPELAIPLAYFAGMHAFAYGATIGKAVLGIAVRAAGEERVGLGRATGRAIATFVLWITFVGGIVDLTVGAADSRRQWVHDKIAGTVVVRTRA